LDTILQDGPAFAGIEDTTELSPLPIKDDINPVSFVKQTFGEAKPKYYVMMVGGGVPTRPHRSRWWAEQEAKRLAAKFPDKVFHVLKVKGESIEEETPEFYERLNAVITRARAVNIDGNRNAVAAGPFGPLWADDTKALIEFNDEQMSLAA
jgi:hypothetical protein